MIVQKDKEAELSLSKLGSKMMSYLSMASLISVDSSSDFNSGVSTAPTPASSSISGYGSEMSLSDDEYEEPAELERLIQKRKAMMQDLRESFYNMDPAKKQSILSFLTTINREIVCAKAMFLAYSDPFEKYRALLFEYAHTLGHGVEAFMNGLYMRAEEAGIDYSDAFRLHGQCVGMAVVWAGEMSRTLGYLEGDGFL